MTDYPRGSEPPTGITPAAALRWDAEMLQDAMLEAVRTSPDSFITTVEEVKTRPLDSWIEDIRSSTWAVAQRNGQVVGIVAGKRPDPASDIEDDAVTRYIESVWIDPDFRQWAKKRAAVISPAPLTLTGSRGVSTMNAWSESTASISIWSLTVSRRRKLVTRTTLGPLRMT